MSPRVHSRSPITESGICVDAKAIDDARNVIFVREQILTSLSDLVKIDKLLCIFFVLRLLARRSAIWILGLTPPSAIYAINHDFFVWFCWRCVLEWF